jgi:hypothetical protein
MAIGISMVMLADDGIPDLATLSNFLRENYPDLPEVSNAESKEGSFAFNLGEADVVLGKMSGPIPWSDLEGPCATSILWRNAANEVQEHKTHIIVTVSVNKDVVSLATLLTQATASVLAACPCAIGVYWGNATLLVPKAIFVEFATSILPKGPPVHIWIDTRVGRQESKGSAGFTTGLDALGHMEIETEASPEEPGALRERLYLLAEYVLSSGRTINDGDTVGEDVGEKIRVEYSESAFGNEKKVMRLIYEKPSAKSKWKFW